MVRVWIVLVGVLAALFGAAWASDFITMQGERTIYTVDCAKGQWQGDTCTGELRLAGRFRYRALKAHNEVIFWVVGERGPSSKFTDCTIEDGRNWSCKPNADAARSITLQMVHGTPMPGPADVTRPFHAIAKWRWHLLERGVTLGNTTANAPHVASKVTRYHATLPDRIYARAADAGAFPPNPTQPSVGTGPAVD